MIFTKRKKKSNSKQISFNIIKSSWHLCSVFAQFQFAQSEQIIVKKFDRSKNGYRIDANIHRRHRTTVEQPNNRIKKNIYSPHAIIKISPFVSLVTDCDPARCSKRWTEQLSLEIAKKKIFFLVYLERFQFLLFFFHSFEFLIFFSFSVRLPSVTQRL